MSYTKEIFEDLFNNPINSIKQKTLEQNDCSSILKRINNLLSVREKFVDENVDCGTLWNEICIDTISVVNSAFSGFYRTASIGLRSVFEMACSSVFYYDHMIEYHMFKEEDMKADKYVSVLVNEYNFFKTKYIRAFYRNIKEIQSEEDSISKYLMKLYGELSDVVHGRYNKLSNMQEFHIEYNIEQYKQFENLFIKTIDILLVLAILRFNITIEGYKEIYKNTGVIKYE
ncbi:hypothetical protein AALA00_03780 [Lachnospiraceae bacterium 46-15]